MDNVEIQKFMDKIDACPFCYGYTLSLSTELDKTNHSALRSDVTRFYFVECRQCLATGPQVENDAVMAIIKWNNRG